jgi:hypothetical protein
MSHFDVLALTETWLTPEFASELLFPSTYKVYRSDRDPDATGRQRGGGVLLASHAPLKCKRMSQLEVNSNLADVVWIEVSAKPCPLLIGNHYFFPSFPPNDYLAYLGRLQSSLLPYLDTHHIVLLGDFNLPDFVCTNSGSRVRSTEVHETLSEFMSVCNLYQVNCIRNTYDRLLDLCFTNSEFLSPELCSSPLVAADHYHPPLFLDMTCLNIQFVLDRKTSQFAWHLADYSAIAAALSDRDIWGSVLGHSDVDTATRNFTDTVERIISSHVPRRTTTQVKFPHWFSPELRKRLTLKEKYRRRYKRSNDVRYEFAYYHYRDTAAALLRRDRQLHLDSLAHGLRSNPKSFWNVTGTRMKARDKLFPALQCEGRFATSNEENADILAQTFADVYTVCTPTTTFREAPRETHQCTSLGISTFHFTPSDIINAVRYVKASRHSPDGVPGGFVQDVIDFLIIPVFYIFRLSVITAKFPGSWKNASVIPIHKKGARTVPSNYRPISLLPYLSKVFERVIYQQLLPEFTKIVSPTQHAFIPGRSTCTNLCSFMARAAPAVDNGGQLDCIYLDCTKAFDLLPHNVILECLRKRLGCSDHVLSWFKSYLSCRVNRVLVHGEFSSTVYDTPSGVPQGSILGPLLFCLVVNSVQKYSNSSLEQFADDLKIFRQILSTADCEQLQRDALSVVAHLKELGLSCNPSKSCVVRFTKRRKPVEYDYKLNNESVQVVDTVKDLGVIFDRKLLFNDQVSDVRKRSLRSLGILLRTARELQLPFFCKRTLYYAHVHSVLTYCSPVWNSLSKTSLERLESAHKRCVYRLLDLWSSDLSYEDACETFDVRPLAEQLILNDLKFFCNVLSGAITSPGLLTSINFHVRNPQYNFRPPVSPFYPLHSNIDPLSRSQRMVSSLLHDINFDPYNVSSSQLFAAAKSLHRNALYP